MVQDLVSLLRSRLQRWRTKTSYFTLANLVSVTYSENVNVSVNNMTISLCRERAVAQAIVLGFITVSNVM